MKKLLALGWILAMGAQAAPVDIPDAAVTPGVVNTGVTQANIQTTICVSSWTKTIRPSANYTNKLKALQMASGVYQSNLPANAFEEDHLISLELGGNPVDRKNLWPQHWSAPYGAHQKDQLENFLHRAVCSRSMTLAKAQELIAGHWVEAYQGFIERKGHD